MAAATVQLSALLRLVLSKVAGVQVGRAGLASEAFAMPARACLGHLLGEVHCVLTHGTAAGGGHRRGGHSQLAYADAARF